MLPGSEGYKIGNFLVFLDITMSKFLASCNIHGAPCILDALERISEFFMQRWGQCHLINSF